jgi:hypothetical protein
MPSTTILVVCPDCKGTNDAPDGVHECGWCNRGHIAVDRAPDGGVPEGYTEWLPALLPNFVPLPDHPRCIP